MASLGLIVPRQGAATALSLPCFLDLVSSQKTLQVRCLWIGLVCIRLWFLMAALPLSQAWGIVDEPCDPAIVAMIVPMAGLGQRQLEPVFCLGLQKIRFRLIASDLRCSR
jgi:hypothetical protein